MAWPYIGSTHQLMPFDQGVFKPFRRSGAARVCYDVASSLAIKETLNLFGAW